RRPRRLEHGCADAGLVRGASARRAYGPVDRARRGRPRRGRRRPADEADRLEPAQPRRVAARDRPVLDPPRAELGDRLRPVRERDRRGDRADGVRGGVDAALLRALGRPPPGTAGRARPADRRLDLEPDRPGPARPRHGLPRPALVAGVQPGRLVHRDRGRDPLPGAAARQHLSPAPLLTSRSLVVPAEAAGERLDRFLASLPEIGSRAAAERLLEHGGALVEGEQVAKSHRLAGGERIELELPEEVAPELVPEDVPLRIAYEDEYLLVVDKPAGVVVHPAPGHASGTLVHGLAGVLGGGDAPDRPGIVHRLDRDTSGLMVVARTEDSYRGLRNLVRRRALERRYKALVKGRPQSWRGRIEAPIG